MAACSGLLEIAVVCAKVGDKVAASESFVVVRPGNHPQNLHPQTLPGISAVLCHPL